MQNQRGPVLDLFEEFGHLAWRLWSTVQPKPDFAVFHGARAPHSLLPLRSPSIASLRLSAGVYLFTGGEN
jgi:hypothetical protein